MSREISILIPAYQSAAFIGRTLGHARAQSWQKIRILVSVDQSSDATAELAREQAEADPRITVIEHKQRLGWAGNVNFLLDQVETPFCFTYFHDDVIAPEYAATLLASLEGAPDAASVHCNMGHFGGGSHLLEGRAYGGDAATRLMTFLVAPHRGAPLRSLMRTERITDVRLPDDQPHGLYANEPYLMRLLLAGPALHCPKTLYMRWHERSGGLVERWTSEAPEAVLNAHKSNIARALALYDDAIADDSRREALRFATYLWILPYVHALEASFGRRLFTEPRELHAAFTTLEPPPSTVFFDEPIQHWCAERWRLAQEDLRERGIRL